MFIRIIKYRLPNSTKSNLFLNLIKAEMIPMYAKKSECLSVEFLSIGEGQLLSIAKYKSKDDYDATSKWSLPIFTKNVKELEGTLEALPGEIIASYYK